MFCKICFRPNAKCHKRFGGNGCHACAAFFRRNSYARETFVCIGTGKCLKEPSLNGLKCKKCRYKKCEEFGMKVPKIIRKRIVSENDHDTLAVLMPSSPEVSVSSSEFSSSTATSLSSISAASSSTPKALPQLLPSNKINQYQNINYGFADASVSPTEFSHSSLTSGSVSTPSNSTSPPLIEISSQPVVANNPQKIASTIDTLLETAVKYPNLLELYLFKGTRALLKISLEILKHTPFTERIYFLSLLFEKDPITFDELEIVCLICICKFELPWLPQIQQLKIKEYQQLCWNRILKKEENRFSELIVISQNCLNIFGALLKL